MNQEPGGFFLVLPLATSVSCRRPREMKIIKTKIELEK